MFQINLFELELARFELGLDVLDEMEVRLLGIGAVRVAGHGDVALRTLLIQRRRKFAPGQERLLQFGHGLR